MNVLCHLLWDLEYLEPPETTTNFEEQPMGVEGKAVHASMIALPNIGV